MRIHNHRMAMNTRIANRFGQYRFITPPGPITPCDRMAIGNPTDVYSFMPDVDRVLLIIHQRQGANGSALAGATDVVVENATLDPLSNTRPILGFPDKARYAPVLQTVALKCTPGVLVTIHPNRPGPGADPFLDKWTMVQVVGVVGSGPIGNQRATIGKMVAGSNGTGTQMRASSTTDVREIISHAMLGNIQRLPLIPAKSTSLMEETRLCSGTALDDFVVDPGQVTGGAYHVSFYELQKLPYAFNAFAQTYWNQTTNPESASWYARAEALLMDNTTCTGMITVTKH